MGHKKYNYLLKFIKSEKGQSAVEYILLLLVVGSLTFTVLKSRAFQDFFGEDSAVFQTLARRTGTSYRFPLRVNDDIPVNPPDDHPGFAQSGGSSSRFFTFEASSEYP